jgi:hypothetical protein
MRLGDPAELGFPIAVADDPVETAFAGVGFPAGSLGGGEIDVRGGALRVVRVEDDLDLIFAFESFRDRRFDALACEVGNFAIEDLRRISAAGTREVAAICSSPNAATRAPSPDSIFSASSSASSANGLIRRGDDRGW